MAMKDRLVGFASPYDEHKQNPASCRHLQIKYKILYAQAKKITSNCPIYKLLHMRAAPSSINPRGLQPNELWQIDVTHVSKFKKILICS